MRPRIAKLHPPGFYLGGFNTVVMKFGNSALARAYKREDQCPGSGLDAKSDRSP